MKKYLVALVAAMFLVGSAFATETSSNNARPTKPAIVKKAKKGKKKGEKKGKGKKAESAEKKEEKTPPPANPPAEGGAPAQGGGETH